MNNKLIFEFNKKLENHIKRNDNYVTEDIIRFLFYRSFINLGNNSSNITNIEKQYTDLSSNYIKTNNNNNPRIDMYIDGKYAIEFKLHSSKNKKQPDKTGQFGELINDMCRLSTIDKVKVGKYLIYLTDGVMNDYITKRNNVSDDFKDMYLNTNKSISLYDCINTKKGKTYYSTRLKSIKQKGFIKYSKSIVVKLGCSIQIANEYYLKIFQVK